MSREMSYQIKLEVFEGPFDLLLSLIAKQKVDIYDIPIARITDEYLTYLKAMEEMDLDVATEFLLVAVTLLDIKASALLPKEESTEPDEDALGPDEARENLVARLLEYKKFKSVAVVLGTRYISESKFHIREVDVDESLLPSAPELIIDASKEVLAYIFAELTHRLPSVIDADHITQEPIRVEDFVVLIRERLGRLGRQSFRELIGCSATKGEIIASFLAILEMYKRGEVEIGQAETFGEIEIEVVREEVLAV